MMGAAKQTFKAFRRGGVGRVRSAVATAKSVAGRAKMVASTKFPKGAAHLGRQGGKYKAGAALGIGAAGGFGAGKQKRGKKK